MSAPAQRRVLLGLAAFAMVWVVVRAHVQAITIDEAVTYMNFVFPEAPTYWTPHANNHVLNSVLMRVFTGVFGASNLTVRAGALTGAALFILSAFLLSTLIAQSFLLRVSLFVCLVFNPFIFDFLVAARGYGLASGFLLWAVYLVAHAKDPRSLTPSMPLMRACGLASVCAALSFASNFSFAFVDAATIVLLYLWASEGASFKIRLRVAGACFLPALLITGALAPLLLQWTEPLTYGAAHLSETFKSIYQASFYELDPSVSDLLFIDVPGVVVPLFGIIAIWRGALTLIHWRSPRNVSIRWFAVLAAIPILAATAALLAHWVMFRITRTPLPQDRTAIYLVFLCTLFLGTLAAIPIATRAGDLTRRALTILLIALGSYFMLCFRVSYFKEWKWDADTDKIYAVLAGYNRACGLKDIVANWRFDGSLNYYFAVSGREAIPPLPHFEKYPDGKRAYVVYQPEDGDFLKYRQLDIVYQSPTGAVIALDSQVEPPPGESQCPIGLPDQSK